MAASVRVTVVPTLLVGSTAVVLGPSRRIAGGVAATGKGCVVAGFIALALEVSTVALGG